MSTNNSDIVKFGLIGAKCGLWRQCNTNFISAVKLFVCCLVHLGNLIIKKSQTANDYEVLHKGTLSIWNERSHHRYNDVIMTTIASQITSLTIVYSAVYLGTDEKTWKLCVTGLCAANSPATGEFPAQWASNAENGSIWWRHHDDVW